MKNVLDLVIYYYTHLIFQVYQQIKLFEIDQKQLKASFQLFVKPNHYVISGGDNVIYYEVNKTV